MAKEQSKTGDVFDLDRIRSLIELMKEHDLSEVDLRQAEQQIRLARGTTVVAAPTVVAASGTANRPLSVVRDSPPQVATAVVPPLSMT